MNGLLRNVLYLENQYHGILRCFATKLHGVTPPRNSEITTTQRFQIHTNFLSPTRFQLSGLFSGASPYARYCNLKVIIMPPARINLLQFVALRVCQSYYSALWCSDSDNAWGGFTLFCKIVFAPPLPCRNTFALVCKIFIYLFAQSTMRFSCFLKTCPITCTIYNLTL